MNAYFKIITITFLCLLSNPHLFGQVYNHPISEKQNLNEVEILKITINDKYTIVECLHINKYNSGWASAMPNTFIRVSGKSKELELLKTHTIPVFPKKHYYKKVGEKLRYKLYFPPVNPTVEHLDLIEFEGSNKAFNFYKIKLKPMV